tara:strand:+ start:638 stop:1432 length:795 start_codon:yes stop_codon:yes gene_type:complete
MKKRVKKKSSKKLFSNRNVLIALVIILLAIVLYNTSGSREDGLGNISPGLYDTIASTFFGVDPNDETETPSPTPELEPEEDNEESNEETQNIDGGLCEDDTDCVGTNTPFCHETRGFCVECKTSKPHCRFAKPICDVDEGICKLCNTDQECEDKNPRYKYCNYNIGDCVRCISQDSKRNNCGVLPVCSTSGNECVECNTPFDCIESRFCVSNTCMDCINDNDCSTLEERNVCVSSKCYDCTDDSHCSFSYKCVFRTCVLDETRT